MKKFILPVLALFSAIQFISCNTASTDSKDGSVSDESNSKNATSENASGRYQLDAAIVTSKITNSMMAGDITTVLYFENHGEKEMTKTSTKISMMGQNIATVSYSLTKDDWTYSWNEGEATGHKFQLKEIMDPAKMDYEKMSEEMKKEFGVKKVGSETILGKKCEKYEMNKDGMGMGNYWLWKNIPMKSETKMSGLTISIEVTSLDEDPNFSKTQFDVPANITFEELIIPSRK